MKSVLLYILSSVLTFYSYSQQSAKYLSEDKYTDFIQITPIEYTEPIPYYKADGSRATAPIEELAGVKNYVAITHFINDIKSFTTVSITDQSGQVQYLVNSFSSKNNTYKIQADWLQCRSVDVFDDKGEKIGEVLIGVGVRITANITTKEKNLNLSQILSAGATINHKKTTGQIEINVIGLESKEVTALTPVLHELNTTSIQNAIQTMATLKTKIYDAGTDLYPKIVAVKKLRATTPVTQKEIIEQFKKNMKTK